MTNAAPSKNFAVPEFAAVPVAEMPKQAQTKYMSLAEKQSQTAFDNFVKNLKPGQAGVATVPAGSTPRTIMARIRGAAGRCEIELGILRLDPDGSKVYVTLKSVNGATPPAAR